MTTRTADFQQTTPDRTKCIFIALVEDGIPKFSESPVPHATRKSAADELERLARAHPGKQFAIFVMNSTLVSTKPTVFKGSDLFKDAPVGEYQTTNRAYKSRFVVMENDGNRVVLFIGTGGHLSPMSPSGWATDTFKLLPEARTIFAK